MQNFSGNGNRYLSWLFLYKWSGFTYQKLGPLAERFDSELSELLAPYSENGTLSFRVRAQLAWCKIRDR